MVDFPISLSLFKTSFGKEDKLLFTGQYVHSIDEKGRLIVPAKLRSELGESFYVTRGLDNCIFCYSRGEWESIVEKFKEANLTSESGRRFSRFFFGSASLTESDKQGRILIPQPLKEWAGLKKDVVSAGILNRVEIWDKDSWDKNNDFGDMNGIAEQMASLGVAI